MSMFNFEVRPDPDKKDRKKVPSIIVCDDSFTMSTRQASTLVSVMDTYIETKREDNPDTSLENIRYELLVNRLMKPDLKDKIGSDLGAWIGMSSGHSNEEEPLRSFIMELSEMLNTSENIFGQNVVMGSVKYEDIQNMTLDDYKTILLEKVDALSDDDMATFKETADKKATENGLKDGFVILKAPRKKKEAAMA